VGVTLIVALALVAISGTAASRTPSGDAALDPALFERVDADSTAEDTAATTYSLDPAVRSGAALEPDSTIVEGGDAAAPARAAAAVPVPRRRVVEKATPGPTPTPRPAAPAVGSVTVSTSGWRLAQASWYGPGFYGHRTACGKTLTTGLLGVAHKTLPCGTLVSFRNPSNGKTITVPVVDRGPYVAGREWDLTAATCGAIGHCYTGSVQWRFA
jgi:rare lipoprotein A (peptidoglycan hydrolase)